MMKSPGNPAARGFFAPQRFEADVHDCEVIGDVPLELNGAFIRVGGDWDYPPKHSDDSIFSQDGYVSRFRFRNGKVDYRGRWVQTPRLLANRAAGRQLYGFYRNPYDCEPEVRDPDRPWLATVANTAVLGHAGMLFALKEDSRPYRIDPDTLETGELWDFGGKYTSQTFTAHPKVDPMSGELLAFGYEATGLASDDLFFYTIDPAGTVTRETRIKVPYVSMIHDWAVTQEHVIFPVFGYVTSLEQLKAGEIHWKWDRNAPTLFGVLPRDGEAKDIRWFRGPQRAVVHTFNARTEGSKVILDAPIFDTNPFPFFPYADGSKWDPVKSRALIRRITFDLNSRDDGYREEVLFPDHEVVDLCRIDDRFATIDCRYGFAPFRDRTKPFDEVRAGNAGDRVTNSYGIYDLKDGTMRSFFAGDTHSLQEPEFVPRGPSAAEGDGWLIGVANNYAEMRSELVIVDTARPGDGAVARVILPFRSNVQVHGRWYADGSLPFDG